MFKYCQSHTVEASKVGDRTVLYDRESKASLVLNPTGSQVWEWLADSSTESELVEDLAEAFPSLGRVQAEQDISNYLRELVSQGVAVVVDS